MRILIFGNSVTQGYNDTECGGWANRLLTYTIKKRVESDYTYAPTVFNLGISGGNTTDLLERIDAELGARLAGKDDGVVLFAIGVNDSQYDIDTDENRIPVEVYEKNLRELISKTQKYTRRIVFVGIPPVDEQKLMPIPWKMTHGYNNTHVQKYNSIREKICTEEGLSFISMNDIFKEDSLDAVLPDGLHPNAEGHRLMFERVKSELEKLNIL